MSTATINRPRRHPPDRRVRHTLIALAVALVWVGLWWIYVAPHWNTAAPSRRPVQGLRVVYAAPAAATESLADVLNVRSPALFSLPSAKGFSRPLLDEKVRARPPARAPASAAYLLPRDDGMMERGASYPVLLAARPGTNDVPALSRATQPPVFVKRVAPTNYMLHIVWKDGLEQRPMQVIPVGDQSPWRDDKPWEASAFVELDEWGAVQRVFLEKGTASRERNAAIVRVLKTFRAGPAASRTGRVVIRYTSDAALAPPLLPEAAR